MTLQRPLVMQASGGDTPFAYAAIASRQAHDIMYATEGVIALGLQVTQRAAGVNMSVDVAAGACVITGDDVSLQGKYLCVNDAGALNITVPAAPGSGTRIHRVIARIKDKAHSGSWTTYEWTVELLADTGSGTPATPNSAINLCRVTVTAGQVTVVNANLTDDRVSALIAGGRPLIVSSDSGRPPNPQPWESLGRSDTGLVETYNGTSWMGRGGRVGVLSTATLSNTTTETVIGTVSNALEANLPVNATYRGWLAGNCNGTSSTPTFTLRIYLDSTAGTLLYSHGVTYVAGGGVKQWNIDAKLQVSTAGASGQMRQAISWNQNVSVTGAADQFMDTTTHVVDFTAGHSLVITGQFSAASASNSATVLSGSWIRE